MLRAFERDSVSTQCSFLLKKYFITVVRFSKVKGTFDYIFNFKFFTSKVKLKVMGLTQPRISSPSWTKMASRSAIGGLCNGGPMNTRTSILDKRLGRSQCILPQGGSQKCGKVHSG